jgi:hypothetical protein
LRRGDLEATPSGASSSSYGRSGAFSRWEQQPETLTREHDLDKRAARNRIAYLHEQQPPPAGFQRTIVFEQAEHGAESESAR